jgi:hypothetical protein
LNLDDDDDKYCDDCGEAFEDHFDMVDHYLGDDDDFNPMLVLPNGYKLMLGSLLRFLNEHADNPEQIRQITQSVYITLYAANKGLDMVTEMVEEMVVNSEMLRFDDSLHRLLTEDKPNEEPGE